MEIFAYPCSFGDCLPLLPQQVATHYAPVDSPIFKNTLSAGIILRDMASGENIFQISGFFWYPMRQSEQNLLPAYQSIRCPLLVALTDIRQKTQYNLQPEEKGFACAVITLSDKGFQGLRKDESGPAIVEMISGALNCRIVSTFMLPDHAASLRALITDLALNGGYDLILTTGGTGIGERDITPDVTNSLIDKPMPGISQAMMQTALQKTPYAMISRAAAGLIGSCLIINLPGSVKAVQENLAPILPALEHALKKANGDSSDCGREI